MPRPPMLASPLHFTVNAACAYETYSLTTGKVPPLSALGAHSKKATLAKITVVCTWLGAHFWTTWKGAR